MSEDTTRIKLTVAYDGSCFQGSQKQPHKQTVDDTLEHAFQKVGIHSSIIPSGRTDTGVHALGQVLHIDVPTGRTQNLQQLQYALQRALPPSVFIRNMEVIPPEFHARFSATSRLYRYLISTRPVQPFHHQHSHYEKNLDWLSMQHAAPLFNGTHDFANFRKTGSDEKTTVRTIRQSRFYSYGNYHIFSVEGNGFLRSQVRLMMGFLLEIGKGNLSSENLLEQLQGHTQYHSLPATPNGLYLCRVKYSGTH